MINNKVSKAVRLAIAFGAVSTAAFSACSFAAEEEKLEKVEKITVTGSRIQRTEISESAPIFSYGEEDIQVRGFTNAADLLNQSPLFGGSLTTGR